MTANGLDVKIHEAAEHLNAAEAEVLLDFSSVAAVDSPAIRSLEDLADLADGKSARVVLRAVNMNVYRVFKQLNLARRFTFR